MHTTVAQVQLTLFREVGSSLCITTYVKPPLSWRWWGREREFPLHPPTTQSTIQFTSNSIYFNKKTQIQNRGSRVHWARISFPSFGGERKQNDQRPALTVFEPIKNPCSVPPPSSLLFFPANVLFLCERLECVFFWARGGSPLEKPLMLLPPLPLETPHTRTPPFYMLFFTHTHAPTLGKGKMGGCSSSFPDSPFFFPQAGRRPSFVLRG